MSLERDETFLNVDGLFYVDPADDLRLRAQEFINSRKWSTDQVFYWDQSEPPEETERQPAWSMGFEIGLDHIKSTQEDWRSDISALLSFLQSLQSELQNEFLVEVRYRSKLWYSEHITFVDEETAEPAVACDMILRRM